MIIWDSGVCKCHLEYVPNADGTLKKLVLTRACAFHIALDGKPELFTTLCAEGGLMSHSVETLKNLDPTKEVLFAFDADRNLTVQVIGATLTKSALQAAVDAVVGSGKVTVV